MTRPHAVIIGAGIGGIATANLLAKAGYRVSVYEKNSQPGGRAGLLEKDGFRFDTGPSWYLMPQVFDHYFKLFGKNADDELQLRRLTPAYKVFFENKRPITISSDLEKDAACFESIEPGSGKRLREYVKQGEKIYQLAMKHFLYSNFTSTSDFAHRDIIAHSLTMSSLAFQPIDRYVNTFVRDQRLRQILEYPMVFLGASPFNAPAIYSLMSALDFKEGVFYPEGGLYTLIERLVELSRELGVSYFYEREVAHITNQNNHATGITLKDGSFIAADVVISNADLHFTETTLVDPRYQTYPARYWQKKRPGPSALLCYLGVKGSLPELQHHNLLFVDKWQENFDAIYNTKAIPSPASLYVCKPSATDPTVAPKDHENVFVLVPLPPGVSINSRKSKKLATAYIQQLAKTTGIPDFANRIVSKTFFGPDDFATKFNAWQSTALGPAHILSQSAFFRSRNKSKKLSNVYYVGGSTVPGIGLPMCLIGAELIYKRLAGDRRGGPIPSIENLVGER